MLAMPAGPVLAKMLSAGDTRVAGNCGRERAVTVRGDLLGRERDLFGAAALSKREAGACVHWHAALQVRHCNVDCPSPP